MSQRLNIAGHGPVNVANDVNADKINNISVNSTAPTDGQILKYVDSASEWQPSTSSTTDEKAGVSSNDTTPGYLDGKLVAGSNITLTEGNDGGDETLTIASTGGGAVDSVFTRTGAVVAATNDYTWAQIDKSTSSIADITTKNHTDLTAGDGSDHSDVTSNTTHRTSNGTDHSYIDQDVTSGATPTFGGTNITTELSNDTTPQLGGDLDLNSNNIDFPSTANISDVKDEDNMASNSATMLATQQSIKAYSDSATQTMTNKTLTNSIMKTQTLTDQATVTWNADSGGFATVTYGGDRTMGAVTNQVSGGVYYLIAKAGGSARTITWNANFLFPSGNIPTSFLSGSTNVIQFISDGTNMYGVANFTFS